MEERCTVTATARRHQKRTNPRRNPLPPAKPRSLVVQIDHNETNLKRLLRRLEVLRKPCSTPGDPHKAIIHLATIAGLQALLDSPCHGMTYGELEDHLRSGLPPNGNRDAVIRLALYAIDRELRKELKLAHHEELRALKSLVRHPISY